jgi:hypothetical protein
MQNLLDKTKIGVVDFVRPSNSLLGTLNTSAGENAITPLEKTSQSTPSYSGVAPINSQQNPQGGSLVDFQKVMRSVSKNAYNDRKAKEGKVTDGQFDPSKVSGSVFKSIMDSVEGNRGQDISKVYASSVEAAKFDIEQKQKAKEFDAELAQKKEEFYGNHPELNYGFSNVDGMRTDRHNNPTAFTTDIAKQAGLVEGVDYVRGDAFPDNPNMFTAKLLGNPLETTIRVIDKIGFNTQDGNNRWVYTDSIAGANNQAWSKMGFQDKAQVIKEMYRHEGGNGSLFGINAGGDRKLSDKQTAIVKTVAGAFDNEPSVKRFGMLQEANSFVQSMDPNTTSSMDDSGLVYAFSKAMDPDSAVREGEYATVQKNAQSLSEAFGFNVMRVVNNMEFLTPEARINIKNTIQSKFNATKKSYDKVYEEYGRRINEMTNINDGTKYLTQYSLSGATAGTKMVNDKEVESVKSKYNLNY